MAAAGMPQAGDGRARFDNLQIDYGARTVSLDGAFLQLTRSEFDLLARLTRSPGIVVSSGDLLAYIWDEPWMGDETSIETHVSRLRRKLGESATSPRFIWTIRGVGYKFQAPQDAAEPSDAPVSRPSRRLLMLGVIAVIATIALGVIGVAAYTTLRSSGASDACAPGYDPCLPIAEDLDCPQIRQVVHVQGDDPYGLDRDGDGLGCTLYREPDE
jgi:DNA-binding winged helix-turn-helix (wHTH) protein